MSILKELESLILINNMDVEPPIKQFKPSKKRIDWNRVTLPNQRINMIVLQTLLEVFEPEFSVGTSEQREYIQRLKQIIASQATKQAA